jgi:methenyltetrahydromethanopterin cyclohydrolase
VVAGQYRDLPLNPRSSILDLQSSIFDPQSSIFYPRSRGGSPVAASLTLNERAQRLADHMAANAAALRIAVQQSTGGARLIDCGIMTEGGLNAGLALARVCLAGQAEVSLVPGDVDGVPCPLVQVATDQPVLACMAAQYAGWEV